MCIELYQSGKMSVDEIVAKYSISTDYVLWEWIKRYNANRERKDSCPKKEVYMADARRKTTMKERKEIVEYCIITNAIIRTQPHCRMYSTVRCIHELRNMTKMEKMFYPINEDVIKQTMRLVNLNVLDVKISG